MKNLRSLLLVIICAGLDVGCASIKLVKAYPGAERPAAQLVTVIVPASIEVCNINGEKLPRVTFMLREKQYTITILPGPQDWTMRYYEPLAEGYYADPQAVTESPWMPFKFEAVAGQTYRLDVQTPREDPKLRRTKEHVSFSVATECSAVSVQPSATSQPKPELQPVMVPVVPPKPVEAPAGGSAPSPPPPPSPQLETPQTLESAALGQLKKWWGVAGPEEQRAFRAWLKTQP